MHGFRWPRASCRRLLPLVPPAHRQPDTCPPPPPCARLQTDPVAALRQKLDAVSRELSSVTEEDYARLASRHAVAPLPPPPALQLSMEALQAEIREQHVPAPQAQPEVQVQANIVPLNIKPLDTGGLQLRAEGTGEEVLLQGFNWDRCVPLPLVSCVFWAPPSTAHMLPCGWLAWAGERVLL